LLARNDVRNVWLFVLLGAEGELERLCLEFVFFFKARHIS